MKPNKKKRVKQLLEAGLCDIEVSREIGLSRERVRQIRNLYGLKKNKGGHCSIISEGQLAEILKLTDEGYPYNQIIRKLNLPFKSYIPLFNLLKKHNIKYKRDYKKILKKHRWTNKLLAEFKKDYEAQPSIEYLSEKYKIGHSRVVQILNYRLNIYRRQSYTTASYKTVKKLKGLDLD